ncbi:hypothetical protein K2173_022701 [Erythroxylum novogranatense]|uniref:non-specific serine/threonine protein kinase n=1 Tax=Erythroxylum novogranatense TaxID=1862640 RepID=A0AAV8SUI2_9ROSI|nr:hypothetical protein K2173_022701 [Erythroxylum novogranatense]
MEFLHFLLKTVSFAILFQCLFVESQGQGQAQVLPREEVELLKTISSKLNVKNWTNITQNSCGSKEWNTTILDKKILSNVTCNCTFAGATVCHVTNMVLKGYNITGNLPSELGKLTYLQELDLSRNYLSGSIPSSLGQLRNLRILSLIANRLNGSIPAEIGSIASLEELVLEDNLLGGPLPSNLGNLRSLKRLLLSANNFTGRIPDTFGNLKNLTDFRIDGSDLSGKIPQFIGNWTKIERLDLQGTSMEGPIPSTISLLKNLTQLRIANLKGPTSKFPDLQDMKNMLELTLRDCSLIGSIPDIIGEMTNLKTLSIEMLLVGSIFPRSMGATRLLGMLILLKGSILPSTLRTSGGGYTFILLSCYCIGTGRLPFRRYSYSKISKMWPNFVGKPLEIASSKSSSLIKKFLNLTEGTVCIPCFISGFLVDLSSNKLTGPIPSTFERLEKLQYMFLLNNSLTGVIPDWILKSKQNLDISYNNFTGSSQSSCQQQTVNFVSSLSSTGDDNSISWCLRKDLPCSRKAQYHSLFINCGGQSMNAENNEYEEDLTTRGPSSFVSVAEKWGYSSTGLYMGNDDANFIAGNSFNLPVTGADFYKSARLAPQSLKYYGLCLRKGSYKVRLHFAEIMYSNDTSFSSLGRRIFDVSIQGNQVLKDFNIMEKAGGVGIGIHQDFDNIYVNGSTLEIHLYWSGKGTTAIPDRGVYGPLISAITVTPNYKVDTAQGLSVGAIIGIVVASCVFVVLILVVLRINGYLGGKKLEENELGGLDLQTGYFSLRQIKRATSNFDSANKIGEGGFGPVYKGVLSDGSVIAVKQLSSKSKQGNREFVNEIGMISALQHPNLVRLHGCCIEGNQLLLVYEYMENNSLARALFGPEENKLKLDWSTRKRILLGVARGLAYLHEESRLKIVHRDIKATNVLLDKDLNAKISDFGLAKLDEEENTHISTRIAGTIGYMAPEYAMRGYLTDKADVYSFGIVALEIVSGKSNTNYRPKEEFVYLLDWAYVLEEQGNLLELVDPDLGSNYSKEEAMKMLNIALLCTNPSPTLRPVMSSVVSMLDGKIAVEAPKIKRGSMNQDARFRAFEVLSQDSQTGVSTFSQQSQVQRSISMDGPWRDSSNSLPSKDEFQESSSSGHLLN